MSWKQTGRVFGSVVGLLLILVVPVSAQTSSSTNYQVNEYYFGTGGEVEQASGSYQAQSSLGALGVGSSSSTLYDAEAGFITASEPFLEMVVSSATVDLGELSSSTTSYGAAQGGSCSCSFHVRTYLSSEYVVYTMSNPPTSEGGAMLDAKATLGVPSSDQSVEEFGINLVDNVSPNIGADPENIPDNSFADGLAASGYSTADQFKYVVGEIVARAATSTSNQAVGHTNYTVSYIAKSRTTTEAGFYTMDHDLVAVATY